MCGTHLLALQMRLVNNSFSTHIKINYNFSFSDAPHFPRITGEMFLFTYTALPFILLQNTRD